MTAVYPEAVHYRDGGEWKEIDNSLVSAKDERGKEVFINAANDVKISLPVSLEGESVIRYEYGSDFISFKLLDIPEDPLSRAVIENDVVKKSQADDISKRLSEILNIKTVSKASYEEAVPGCDIIYTLSW